MSPRALWIPFEVDDLDAAKDFFTERLGLSVVDGWDTGTERGVVLKVAEGAFIELVSPSAGHPPLLAFELAAESEVDDLRARWAGQGGEPHRHPRGHYGFIAPGPTGMDVLVWSEK